MSRTRNISPFLQKSKDIMPLKRERPSPTMRFTEPKSKKERMKGDKTHISSVSTKNSVSGSSDNRPTHNEPCPKMSFSGGGGHQEKNSPTKKKRKVQKSNVKMSFDALSNSKTSDNDASFNDSLSKVDIAHKDRKRTKVRVVMDSDGCILKDGMEYVESGGNMEFVMKKSDEDTQSAKKRRISPPPSHVYSIKGTTTEDPKTTQSEKVRDLVEFFSGGSTSKSSDTKGKGTPASSAEKRKERKKNKDKEERKRLEELSDLKNEHGKEVQNCYEKQAKRESSSTANVLKALKTQFFMESQTVYEKCKRSSGDNSNSYENPSEKLGHSDIPLLMADMNKLGILPPCNNGPHCQMLDLCKANNIEPPYRGTTWYTKPILIEVFYGNSPAITKLSGPCYLCIVLMVKEALIRSKFAGNGVGCELGNFYDDSDKEKNEDDNKKPATPESLFPFSHIVGEPGGYTKSACNVSESVDLSTENFRSVNFSDFTPSNVDVHMRKSVHSTETKKVTVRTFTEVPGLFFQGSSRFPQKRFFSGYTVERVNNPHPMGLGFLLRSYLKGEYTANSHMKECFNGYSDEIMKKGKKRPTTEIDKPIRTRHNGIYINVDKSTGGKKPLTVNKYMRVTYHDFGEEVEEECDFNTSGSYKDIQNREMLFKGEPFRPVFRDTLDNVNMGEIVSLLEIFGFVDEEDFGNTIVKFPHVHVDLWGGNKLLYLDRLKSETGGDLHDHHAMKIYLYILIRLNVTVCLINHNSEKGGISDEYDLLYGFTRRGNKGTIKGEHHKRPKFPLHKLKVFSSAHYRLLDWLSTNKNLWLIEGPVMDKNILKTVPFGDPQKIGICYHMRNLIENSSDPSLGYYTGKKTWLELLWSVPRREKEEFMLHSDDLRHFRRKFSTIDRETPREILFKEHHDSLLSVCLIDWEIFTFFKVEDFGERRRIFERDWYNLMHKHPEILIKFISWLKITIPSIGGIFGDSRNEKPFSKVNRTIINDHSIILTCVYSCFVCEEKLMKQFPDFVKDPKQQRITYLIHALKQTHVPILKNCLEYHWLTNHDILKIRKAVHVESRGDSLSGISLYCAFKPSEAPSGVYETSEDISSIIQCIPFITGPEGYPVNRFAENLSKCLPKICLTRRVHDMTTYCMASDQRFNLYVVESFMLTLKGNYPNNCLRAPLGVIMELEKNFGTVSNIKTHDKIERETNFNNWFLYGLKSLVIHIINERTIFTFENSCVTLNSLIPLCYKEWGVYKEIVQCRMEYIRKMVYDPNNRKHLNSNPINPEHKKVLDYSLFELIDMNIFKSKRFTYLTPKKREEKEKKQKKKEEAAVALLDSIASNNTAYENSSEKLSQSPVPPSSTTDPLPTTKLYNFPDGSTLKDLGDAVEFWMDVYPDPNRDYTRATRGTTVYRGCKTGCFLYTLLECLICLFKRFNNLCTSEIRSQTRDDPKASVFQISSDGVSGDITDVTYIKIIGRTEQAMKHKGLSEQHCNRIYHFTQTLDINKGIPVSLLPYVDFTQYGSDILMKAQRIYNTARIPRKAMKECLMDLSLNDMEILMNLSNYLIIHSNFKSFPLSEKMKKDQEASIREKFDLSDEKPIGDHFGNFVVSTCCRTTKTCTVVGGVVGSYGSHPVSHDISTGDKYCNPRKSKKGRSREPKKAETLENPITNSGSSDVPKGFVKADSPEQRDKIILEYNKRKAKGFAFGVGDFKPLGRMGRYCRETKCSEMSIIGRAVSFDGKPKNNGKNSYTLCPKCCTSCLFNVTMIGPNGFSCNVCDSVERFFYNSPRCTICCKPLYDNINGHVFQRCNTGEAFDDPKRMTAAIDSISESSDGGNSPETLNNSGIRVSNNQTPLFDDEEEEEERATEKEEEEEESIDEDQVDNGFDGHIDRKGDHSLSDNKRISFENIRNSGPNFKRGLPERKKSKKTNQSKGAGRRKALPKAEEKVLRSQLASRIKNSYGGCCRKKGKKNRGGKFTQMSNPKAFPGHKGWNTRSFNRKNSLCDLFEREPLNYHGLKKAIEKKDEETLSRRRIHVESNEENQRLYGITPHSDTIMHEWDLPLGEAKTIHGQLKKYAHPSLLNEPPDCTQAARVDDSDGRQARVLNTNICKNCANASINDTNEIGYIMSTEEISRLVTLQTNTSKEMLKFNESWDLGYTGKVKI